MRNNYNDLIGKKFNKLTLVALPPLKTKCGHKIGIFDCDCGKTSVAKIIGSVLRGATTSCGCVLDEKRRQNLVKANEKLDRSKRVVTNAYKNSKSNSVGVRWDKYQNAYVASINYKKKTYKKQSKDIFELTEWRAKKLQELIEKETKC